MAAGRPPVPPSPPSFAVTHEGHIDMTELNQTVERIVDTKLEDQIEVRSSAFLGEPTVHMDVTTDCMEMTAADARELAAALIEVAEVVDPANPVEAPPVTVTTLPHDDLIFLGVKA